MSDSLSRPRSKKPTRRSATKVSVSPAGAAQVVERGAAPPLSDRFEVEELLGEGGMGRVFVAHDRSLGRTVAIKQLHEALEHDGDALRRFVIEAQVGAQLTHPNILPLYSYERSPSGAPAFAMQLVEGRTLADYVSDAIDAPAAAREDGGAFALKERVGTLLAVCDAIHFAHQRGVIHRDLKPDNVMLGSHREVYVMDWGIARVLDAEESSSGQAAGATPPPANRVHLETAATVFESSGGGPPPTQQGQIVGTPQYMAPEQARGELAQLGPAADQFALGVILAELSTLRPARDWSSLGRALMQAAAGEVAFGPDVDGRSVDPALAAIVRRATATRPEDRYPSVDAMAEDVRRFIRDEPVTVYVEPATKKLLRMTSRRPALSVGIVGGVLLALALVAMTNLFRAQRAAERHARELSANKRLLIAAGDRAHFVDVWFSDVIGGLGALSAAAIETYDWPQAPQVSAVPPLPKLHDSPRHGVPVSFERPMTTWIGQAAGVSAPPSASRWLAVAPWLREALARGLPDEQRDAGAGARQASVEAGRSTLLRSYVGFDDGVFVQYPAREVPAGFDPRTRPWFREGTSTPTMAWSRPMLSADGKTVRIAAVQPLAANGKVMGVAGIDLRVSEVAERLKLDVPGFRRAYLVLPDGRIAVRDGLEGTLVGRGLAPESDLELPRVESETLSARVAAKEPGGIVDEGNRLLVFARLASPPWTYVVEVDADPYRG